MQCCNKHVIIYSGARVSELIRAIRSFMSIDLLKSAIKRNFSKKLQQLLFVDAIHEETQYFDMRNYFFEIK